MSRKRVSKLSKRWKMKKSNSGRSMVEILGVLAIVGVLSIAGFAGIRMLFAKNKANQMYDDLQRSVLTISSRQDLKDLAPNEKITLAGVNENAPYKIEAYRIDEKENGGAVFVIEISNITRKECVDLLHKPIDTPFLLRIGDREFDQDHPDYSVCNVFNDAKVDLVVSSAFAGNTENGPTVEAFYPELPVIRTSVGSEDSKEAKAEQNECEKQGGTWSVSLKTCCTGGVAYNEREGYLCCTGNKKRSVADKGSTCCNVGETAFSFFIEDTNYEGIKCCAGEVFEDYPGHKRCCDHQRALFNDEEIPDTDKVAVTNISYKETCEDAAYQKWCCAPGWSAFCKDGRGGPECCNGYVLEVMKKAYCCPKEKIAMPIMFDPLEQYCCEKDEKAYLTDFGPYCCHGEPYQSLYADKISAGAGAKCCEKGKVLVDLAGYKDKAGAEGYKACCKPGQYGYVDEVNKFQLCCDTEPVLDPKTKTYSCGCKENEEEKSVLGGNESSKLCCPKGELAYAYGVLQGASEMTYIEEHWFGEDKVWKEYDQSKVRTKNRCCPKDLLVQYERADGKFQLDSYRCCDKDDEEVVELYSDEPGLEYCCKRGEKAYIRTSGSGAYLNKYATCCAGDVYKTREGDLEVYKCCEGEFYEGEISKGVRYEGCCKGDKQIVDVAGSDTLKYCCKSGEKAYLRINKGTGGKFPDCCDSELIYDAATDTYTCGCEEGTEPTDLNWLDRKICCPAGQTAYREFVKNDGESGTAAVVTKCCAGKAYKNVPLFWNVGDWGCCDEVGSEPVNVKGGRGEQLCCPTGQTAYREEKWDKQTEKTTYTDVCCAGKVYDRNEVEGRKEGDLSDYGCCKGKLLYNESDKSYSCNVCKGGTPSPVLGMPTAEKLENVLKNIPTKDVKRVEKRVSDAVEVSMACCRGENSTSYWDWTIFESLYDQGNTPVIKCCRGESYIQTYLPKIKYDHLFDLIDKKAEKVITGFSANSYEEAQTIVEENIKRGVYSSDVYLRETEVSSDRITVTGEPDYDRPFVACCEKGKEIVDVVGGIGDVKACCKPGQTAIGLPFNNNMYLLRHAPSTQCCKGPVAKGEKNYKCCEKGEITVDVNGTDYQACCPEGSTSAIEKDGRIECRATKNTCALPSGTCPDGGCLSNADCDQGTFCKLDTYCDGDCPIAVCGSVGTVGCGTCTPLEDHLSNSHKLIINGKEIIASRMHRIGERLETDYFSANNWCEAQGYKLVDTTVLGCDKSKLPFCIGSRSTADNVAGGSVIEGLKHLIYDYSSDTGWNERNDMPSVPDYHYDDGKYWLSDGRDCCSIEGITLIQRSKARHSTATISKTGYEDGADFGYPLCWKESALTMPSNCWVASYDGTTIQCQICNYGYAITYDEDGKKICNKAKTSGVTPENCKEMGPYGWCQIGNSGYGISHGFPPYDPAVCASYTHGAPDSNCESYTYYCEGNYVNNKCDKAICRCESCYDGYVLASDNEDSICCKPIDECDRYNIDCTCAD